MLTKAQIEKNKTQPWHLPFLNVSYTPKVADFDGSVDFRIEKMVQHIFSRHNALDLSTKKAAMASINTLLSEQLKPPLTLGSTHLVQTIADAIHIKYSSSADPLKAFLQEVRDQPSTEHDPNPLLTYQDGLQLMGPREMEALHHFTHGLNYKEVAKAMGVTPNTINDVRKHIFYKTDLHLMEHVTQAAIERGIVPLYTGKALESLIETYREKLTPREKEVFMVIGQGLNDLEAMEPLDASKEETVSALRTQIHRKLDVHNRPMLIRAWVSLKREADRIGREQAATADTDIAPAAESQAPAAPETAAPQTDAPTPAAPCPTFAAMIGDLRNPSGFGFGGR